MALLDQLEKDLIKALKGGDKLATMTLRGLKSDIKYYQIEKKLDKLTDDDVASVLSTAAKRRKDSIEQFRTGGRDDLVEKESSELQIIKAYLPEDLSEDEIEAVAKEAIEETGATSPSDFGKIMKIIMPRVKGRVDGKIVKKIVTRLISPPK
jgi:uncharacterized protein YqeY